ncbi:hypothetical protein OG905_00320 [Streptomyces sp. NBC_00322]|uniref:hypothetical protein n=1 Tax=Streptomyces sp. NBC_00322 TaxID=2975712 RepID=UPI002E2DF20F|nr:hypothetical protein [Streptomyces sp. NBC_00322]
MTENEWNAERRHRLGAWWNLLDEPTKERMKNLGEYEALPEDVAPGLRAARVTYVEVWRGDPSQNDIVYVQPSELRAFLAEKRAE